MHLSRETGKCAVLSTKMTSQLGMKSYKTIYQQKIATKKIKYNNNNSNIKSKLACEMRVLHNELELSMLTPMLLHLYFSFMLFFVGGYSKVKKMSFQS